MRSKDTSRVLLYVPKHSKSICQNTFSPWRVMARKGDTGAFRWLFTKKSKSHRMEISSLNLMYIHNLLSLNLWTYHPKNKCQPHHPNPSPPKKNTHMEVWGTTVGKRSSFKCTKKGWILNLQGTGQRSIKSTKRKGHCPPSSEENAIGNFRVPPPPHQCHHPLENKTNFSRENGG